MTRPHEGKVVIVTGGNSGIGAATAVLFARQGAKVAIAARRADMCDAVARQIAELGGEAVAIPTDVGLPADVQAMVDTTFDRFGRLDYAVNNAGISGPVMTPVADVDVADWDQVMTVNLRGVWLCMKYEIPAMLRNGAGAVVNVSSIYGLKPSDLGHAPYCTSKYGLIGLSKTAAVDYGQRGIRVNVVAPGFTHTEMVDASLEAAPALAEAITAKHSAQRRLGDANETAQAISWLCSDNATFVNGAVLTVDGGDTARLY